MYRLATARARLRKLRLFIALAEPFHVAQRSMFLYFLNETSPLESLRQMKPVLEVKRREVVAGGYAHDDSTVEFYSRVRALASTASVVLDFGAGRGEAAEDPVAHRRALRTLRGAVATIHGVDIDDAVLRNPLLDSASVISPAGGLPFPGDFFDLIVADWVLEHLESPSNFEREVFRCLRPGGWLCARTPNKHGYISTASRLLPRQAEKRIISIVQPDRQEMDIFPKFYRLNTSRDFVRFFPPDRWINGSYMYKATPAYFGNSAFLFSCIDVVNRVLPSGFSPIFMAFARKV